MIVEIYQVQGGERRKTGEVRPGDDGVVITGQASEFLRRFRCRADGATLSYEDGEPWMRALPDNLRGTYLWAEAKPLEGTAAYHEASIYAADWTPADEKLHPRDRKGRFRKVGLPSLGDLLPKPSELEHRDSGKPVSNDYAPFDFSKKPSVTEGPRSKMFLNPYHSSVERAASPDFEPLPAPSSAEQAREKEPGGQVEALLAPDIAAEVEKLGPGEEKRFPEGVLVRRTGVGDVRRVEVGGTPFRPEDVEGSPETAAKFADYERRWDEAGKRLGMSLDNVDQQGFWDGEAEPSVATRSQAERRQIEAAAALVGQHFNQDAMAVFTYDDDGPGGRFSVRIPDGTDRAKLGELIAEGMPEGQGASVAGDEAYFYAADAEEGEKWADGLAEALDSDWIEDRGHFTLISDADYGDRTYEEAIRAAPEARALAEEWADEEGRGADARPEGGSGGSPTEARGLAPGPPGGFRIDGPDGTFWRVPADEVGELVQFEETTARANRFGAQMPGNPMVPLKGVDFSTDDPIGDAVGGTYHGGYNMLPRGTMLHRKPGTEGDSFEITSPDGVVVEIPATDKPKIIATAAKFEHEAEGRLGGDVEEEKEFERSTEVGNPDGPLKPIEDLETYDKTRIALHAQSERILGYEHGGVEVALIQIDGGFGTPWFIDDDGKRTRFRVDGTDIVREKEGEEPVRDPIGPTVDPEAAARVADFLALGAKVQRQIRENGIQPDGEVVDRRFDEPILWPEHLDIAVELGKGDTENYGNRSVFGASPGDKAHPEPYFYVAPWAPHKPSETWNAHGFMGAELSYREAMASEDPERTVREFYERYMKLIDAWLTPEPTSAKSVGADTFAFPVHEASVFATFDEKLHPRGPDGRWIDDLAPNVSFPSSGDAEWDAAATKTAQEIRNMDANNPRQLVSVGAIARQTIDDHPKVKEAEAKFAKAGERIEDYFHTYGHGDMGSIKRLQRLKKSQVKARERVMNERAKAVEQLLRRTRPTGDATGDALKVGRMGGPKSSLEKLVIKESGFFPASWLRAANDNDYGSLNPNPAYPTHGQPRVLRAKKITEWQWQPEAGELWVSDEGEESSRSARLHEMTHLIEHGADFAGMDDKFLREVGVETEPTNFEVAFQFMLADNKLYKLADRRKDFWDWYSGTDYYAASEEKVRKYRHASEVLSTGIEILTGNLRPETVGRDADQTPWDERYRLHLEYALGMLLRGGPPDSEDDLKKAGIG